MVIKQSTNKPSTFAPNNVSEATILNNQEAKKIERNKNKSKKIILVTVCLLVLASCVISFWYLKKKTNQKPLPSPPLTGSIKPTFAPSSSPQTSNNIPNGWKTYKNEEWDFEISYPYNWIVNKDSYAFKEGGDLFSIYIWGKTQKTNTELYDGAALTIGIPIETNKEIEVWIYEYYGEKNEVTETPTEFSKEIINNLTFQKVYGCGMGCVTYYNIKKDGFVYRFVTIAEGPDEVNYLQIFNQILSTFKFTDNSSLTTSNNLSSRQPKELIDTSSWSTKTYPNLFATFKIPPNWQGGEEKEPAVDNPIKIINFEDPDRFGAPDLTVSLYNNPQGLGRKDFWWQEVIKGKSTFAQNGVQYTKNISEWNINAHNALSLFFTEYSMGGSYLIIPKANQMLVLFFNGDLLTNEVFETILSTIKLLG